MRIIAINMSSVAPGSHAPHGNPYSSKDYHGAPTQSVGARRSCVTIAGFSLIELVMVVALMGFGVLMVAGPLQSRSDQACVEQTLTLMDEIETALLGQVMPEEPETRSMGYIPDMGSLPVLVDGQPRGLWTPDTDGDGTDDLLRRCQFIDDGHTTNWNWPSEDSPLYFWMGWSGPYIGMPKDGVLRDGWGNALIFQTDTPDEGDLTILSPGANGIVSGQDTGADADLTVVIRKSRFMAPLAGVIIPSGISGINENNAVDDVGIRLYYAAPAPDQAHTHITDLAFIDPETQSQAAVITEDGYFLFRDVPIGTERFLEIRQPLPAPNADKNAVTYLQVEVLPTLNWMGQLDIRNAYDTY